MFMHAKLAGVSSVEFYRPFKNRIVNFECVGLMASFVLLVFVRRQAIMGKISHKNYGSILFLYALFIRTYVL